MRTKLGLLEKVQTKLLSKMLIVSFIFLQDCEGVVVWNMRTKLGLLKKAVYTIKKVVNSKVVKNTGRTLQKQYHNSKRLLRTIDKKFRSIFITLLMSVH